jgi:cytochrome c2
MKHLFKIFTIVAPLGFIIASCGGNDSTGWEYAPNMYNSRAYEPLSQVDYLQNDNNKDGKNMREPVAGTVSRRNYNTTFAVGDSGSVRDLLLYDKDTITVAEQNWKNPIAWSESVEEQGKVLYERNCQHCHGEKGKGDGPVGVVYKGVPNYSAGAYKDMNDGHIFHVITYGKGRMWSHASQVNAEERWKIVHYVHRLQLGN